MVQRYKPVSHRSESGNYDKEDVYCVVLHVVEGINFIGRDIRDGEQAHATRTKEQIIMNAALNKVDFEVEGASSPTAETIIFNSNCIWECDLPGVKRLKTDNRPVKLTFYTASPGMGRKTVGTVLLQLRGLPIASSSSVNKKLHLKMFWHKLICIGSEFRSHKPEVFLMLAIIKKSLLTTKEFEHLMQFSNRKSPRPAPLQSPGHSITATMLQSQANVYVQYLVQMGLLQVGNDPRVDCDVFEVVLQMKELKNVSKLVKSLHSRRDSQTVLLSFDFIGNVTNIELKLNESDTYALSDVLGLRFKTSLRSLRSYFQRVFYLPINIYLNGTSIANYHMDFGKLLPADSFFNTNSKYVRNGVLVFDGMSRMCSARDLKPVIEYTFSVNIKAINSREGNAEYATQDPTDLKICDKPFCSTNQTPEDHMNSDHKMDLEGNHAYTEISDLEDDSHHKSSADERQKCLEDVDNLKGARLDIVGDASESLEGYQRCDDTKYAGTRAEGGLHAKEMFVAPENELPQMKYDSDEEVLALYKCKSSYDRLHESPKIASIPQESNKPAKSFSFEDVRKNIEYPPDHYLNETEENEVFNENYDLSKMDVPNQFREEQVVESNLEAFKANKSISKNIHKYSVNPILSPISERSEKPSKENISGIKSVADHNPEKKQFSCYKQNDSDQSIHSIEPETKYVFKSKLYLNCETESKQQKDEKSNKGSDSTKNNLIFTNIPKYKEIPKQCNENEINATADQHDKVHAHVSKLDNRKKKVAQYEDILLSKTDKLPDFKNLSSQMKTHSAYLSEKQTPEETSDENCGYDSDTSFSSIGEGQTIAEIENDVESLWRKLHYPTRKWEKEDAHGKLEKNSNTKSVKSDYRRCKKKVKKHNLLVSKKDEDGLNARWVEVNKKQIKSLEEVEEYITKTFQPEGSDSEMQKRPKNNKVVNTSRTKVKSYATKSFEANYIDTHGVDVLSEDTSYAETQVARPENYQPMNGNTKRTVKHKHVKNNNAEEYPHLESHDNIVDGSISCIKNANKQQIPIGKKEKYGYTESELEEYKCNERNNSARQQRKHMNNVHNAITYDSDCTKETHTKRVRVSKQPDKKTLMNQTAELIKRKSVTATAVKQKAYTDTPLDLSYKPTKKTPDLRTEIEIRDDLYEMEKKNIEQCKGMDHIEKPANKKLAKSINAEALTHQQLPHPEYTVYERVGATKTVDQMPIKLANQSVKTDTTDSNDTAEIQEFSQESFNFTTEQQTNTCRPKINQERMQLKLDCAALTRNIKQVAELERTLLGVHQNFYEHMHKSEGNEQAACIDYEKKFEQLEAHIASMKLEMQQQMQLFERRHQEMREENGQLSREKKQLKERIKEMELQIKSLRSQGVENNDLKQLLNEVKIQNERYKELCKSKECYKREWQRSAQRMHELKLEMFEKTPVEPFNLRSILTKSSEDFEREFGQYRKKTETLSFPVSTNSVSTGITEPTFYDFLSDSLRSQSVEEDCLESSPTTLESSTLF